MAKKVAKKGKSPRQARNQKDLFDHRPKKSKAVKLLVDEILPLQDRMDAVEKQLLEKKDALLSLMRKMKMTEYDYDGIAITVVHTVAKDKVKIKLSGGSENSSSKEINLNGGEK